MDECESTRAHVYLSPCMHQHTQTINVLFVLNVLETSNTPELG